MRCLIGIDDINLIPTVKGYLQKIDRFCYTESTSNLETVQKLLLEKQFDFMIASCCQHKDYDQKLLGWIRAKKIDVEVIYITRYNDTNHVQQAFRYGVCDYILLPFSYERFSCAVHTVFDKISYMKKIKAFSQSDIDNYMSINSACYQKNAAASRGGNQATLTKIETYLKTLNNAFTAQDVAYHVGISRVSARRYLENMVEDGVLEIKTEYGKIGRPNKLYEKKS